MVQERVRRRLELRRSSASCPHVNRHREHKKGRGKGGRAGGKRMAISDY